MLGYVGRFLLDLDAKGAARFTVVNLQPRERKVIFFPKALVV